MYDEFLALVSNEVKDWLCVQLDDERFNSLVSYLRNINMKNVTQQFTRQSDKTREEVKAGLLHQWTTQGNHSHFNQYVRTFLIWLDNPVINFVSLMNNCVHLKESAITPD